MNIPGYDAWNLSGPPEYDEPTCMECGEGEELRVDGGDLICFECHAGVDDATGDFYALPTPSEYAQDQADERADYLYEQRKDRMMEDES